jgi:hypothetical protein
MAWHYNRAAAVLALREDSGLCWTIVEACLCGAIPVVSDCEPTRRYFGDGGAVLVRRDSASILEGLREVLHLDDETYAEHARANIQRFAGWTEAAAGPEFVTRLLSLVACREERPCTVCGGRAAGVLCAPCWERSAAAL